MNSKSREAVGICGLFCETCPSFTDGLCHGCLSDHVAESCVYVPFRAPEGVGLLNLDRFFLPKAWLPAINVCALAIGIGMTTSLLPPYTWICTVALLALAIGVVPLTRMFVKLSHHCQRGTANTTMQVVA